MKKSIWKFALKITDKQEVAMPYRAEILSVANQFETICMWAEVDPEEPGKDSRVIEIFGPGQTIHIDMGAERKFIGTVVLRGGDLVFHVYERVS